MLQRKPSNVSDKSRNKPKRSTSFGIFDRQQPTQVKAEEKVESLVSLVSLVNKALIKNRTPTGGLGKKMKNISLTMRKKMGRKYTKALSEEMVSAYQHLSLCSLKIFLSKKAL
uniref:SAM domain, SH3 domain and nuclear localisation signals 1b n=1 Tax=Sinocyclocheilus grahami TaxID=75366 RepID=A0A672P5F0_SINGR